MPVARQAPNPDAPTNYSDTLDLRFNMTMAGGTSLAGLSQNYLRQPAAAEYLLIAADAVFEYERTINELRRRLLWYEAVIAAFRRQSSPSDEYEEFPPVIPMNAPSVRLIDSIVSARVPNSATFTEFDEGEL